MDMFQDMILTQTLQLVIMVRPLILKYQYMAYM